MQSDTKIKPQTETEKLFALDKPSLGNLSYALRHPDTWPEGFVWNYGECTQCAMGLAHALWQQVPKATKRTGGSFMARAFALPFDVATSIFMGHVGAYRAQWIPASAVRTEVSGRLWWKTKKQVPYWDAITPGMVADQIDKYLAGAK